MFKSSILTAVFAAIAVVRADPTPTEPGPNEVFNEDSTCHIAWDVDTTGQWKTMNIELMTGPNQAMVHLTTVATGLDGTDPLKTTFDFTCPEVTPNSDIYFYQFTSPGSPDTLWTTRFAIADKDGNTTPPPNAVQPGPGGADIPWGTGQLIDPSSATPPPPKGGAGNSSSSALSVSSSSSVSGSTASSSSSASSSATSGFVPSSSPKASSSGSKSGSASSSAAPTGAVNNNNSNAAASLSIDSRLLQTAASLAAVAAAFAVVL